MHYPTLLWTGVWCVTLDYVLANATFDAELYQWLQSDVMLTLTETVCSNIHYWYLLETHSVGTNSNLLIFFNLQCSSTTKTTSETEKCQKIQFSIKIYFYNLIWLLMWEDGGGGYLIILLITCTHSHDCHAWKFQSLSVTLIPDIQHTTSSSQHEDLYTFQEKILEKTKIFC